jgi:hypothetical protein
MSICSIQYIHFGPFKLLTHWIAAGRASRQFGSVLGSVRSVLPVPCSAGFAFTEMRRAWVVQPLEDCLVLILELARKPSLWPCTGPLNRSLEREMAWRKGNWRVAGEKTALSTALRGKQLSWLLITKTKYLYKWLICHCISDAIPRLRS